MHLLRPGVITLLMLALAGCAGSQPSEVSPGQQPELTSAAPNAVLTASATTLPSLARPLATPSPTRPGAAAVRTGLRPATAGQRQGPSCGSRHPTGTVVLGLPGGRRALLAIPAGDDGHHRLPLVVGLPGYGRTSEELAAQSRIPARARAARVLAVLPQGAGRARSWNFSGTTGYDDRAFLSALVTRLVATGCADPARVVITGISDGGDMAAFAACALPGRFRAVVTVAASIRPRAGCHRIRIVAVHGDADPLDPYRGGPDGRRGYPAIPPATAAIASWATLDGCRTAVTTRVAPHIAFTTYPCGARLVTVGGGGHTWPAGAPVDPSLGVTTREYDVTSTILRLL